MADSHRPTCLSLCSGIGGLDLGVDAVLGTRVLAFCERDPYAATVLLERMESSSLEPAPVWCGDVRDLDLAPFVGRVDIVTAGYPCQPFSVAGKRNAEEDSRHLWPEVLRVVRQVGARCLVAENVRGHLSLGFDRVLADLADAGFDAEWTVVRASDAGAPHRRERLFLVAYARCARDERRGEPGVVRGTTGEAQGEGDERQRGRDAARHEGEDVADRDMRGREGHDGLVGDPRCSRLEVGRTGTLPGSFPAPWPPGPSGDWTGIPEWCHPAVADAAIRQEGASGGGQASRGAAEGQAPEPDVRGMADGVPARVDRLRCLGNAVVPAQAELALRELFGR